MSWDSYLDNLCAQSNNSEGIAAVKRAGIYSLDGGKSWTSDGHPHGLVIFPKESQKIANVMKSGDFSDFKENGIVLENKHYFFISEFRYDKGVIGRLEGEGVVLITSSISAIIICHLDEENAHRLKDGVRAVFAISDYLKSCGM